jgi:HK97 family phage major capsid protein
MNTVELSNSVQEITRLLGEHSALTSKTTFTKQDEARAAGILARVAILKAGVTVRELGSAHAASLAKELGIKVEDVRSSSELRDAFREYIKTGKVVEVRDQSSANWGRPSGATYTGGDLSGSTTSGKAGGYTTAPEFLAEAATMNLGDYDEIVDASNIVRTQTGDVAPVPVVDDMQGSPAAYVKSQLVGDAVQISGASLQGFASSQAVFGKAYKYLTAMPVAIELEQDAAAVLAVLLPQVFQQRHALGLGDAFVNGSGVGAPLGLSTVAATLSGSNVSTSASSSISGVTLKELEAAYRAMPRQYRRLATWYMCSDMWLQVLELLETSGRANMEGDVQKLFRRPIAVCDSMHSPSTENLAAVLAVPKFLLQRRVIQDGTGIERAMELPGYIESGLCLVKSYVRADFLPILYTAMRLRTSRCIFTTKNEKAADALN